MVPCFLWTTDVSGESSEARGRDNFNGGGLVFTAGVP